MESFRLFATLVDIKQQDAMNEVLEDLRKEFKFVEFETKTRSKKLAPFEISQELIISIASGVASALVIKVLDRIWNEMRKKDIPLQTSGLDAIQKKAEEYLNDLGITRFKMLRRENKGPYVIFVFSGAYHSRHYIRISSSDLQVIEYNRREI